MNMSNKKAKKHSGIFNIKKQIGKRRKKGHCELFFTMALSNKLKVLCELFLILCYCAMPLMKFGSSDGILANTLNIIMEPMGLNGTS